MKILMKILMKTVSVIERLFLIFFGLILILILILFVNEAIISSMHGNAKTVTITRINQTKVSLKLPIRLIRVKGANKEGSQVRLYNADVKKYWGTAWLVGFIPEEKRVFIASSHVGVFFPFLYHYAISDPEAEKILLEYLQKIEPARIVK